MVPWLGGTCLAAPFPMSVPIILLTENLRCFAGRARLSCRSLSKALYRAAEFSATDTSQKPTQCAAATWAPSASETVRKWSRSALLPTK